MGRRAGWRPHCGGGAREAEAPGRSGQVASLVPEAYFISLGPRWPTDWEWGPCCFPTGFGTRSEKAVGEEGGLKLREPVPGFRSCFVQGPGFTDEKRRKGQNAEDHRACGCWQGSGERPSAVGRGLGVLCGAFS